MDKIDFKVTFRGEWVEGYMDEYGRVIFYSPKDGDECRVPKNPFRNTDNDYLKKHEEDYDFILKTIAKQDIRPDLHYWGEDCNRKIILDSYIGDDVVLIINQLTYGVH